MRHVARRVLIVDDSATIRKNLARIFAESEEIEVVGEAADAQQGLELARTLHPDLVTLDLRMPGGSGLNVIKQIKQLEPSPIVMVLTNYAHPAYRKRAAEAGADFFFDKSSEFQQALDVFRNGGTQLNDHSGKQERS
jgi:DNA-binding NarL/FixJ family response regulator